VALTVRESNCLDRLEAVERPLKRLRSAQSPHQNRDVAKFELAGVHQFPNPRRDQARWNASLNLVRDHARNGTNLMPAILEAVESYATVGEIAAAMREVFGEYQESVVI